MSNILMCGTEPIGQVCDLLAYKDVTETTDGSGYVNLDTDYFGTNNFINVVCLNKGSTFIKVCKRYDSESSPALRLLFENSSGNAVTNTSIKFRVWYLND